jgi:hypothetical protein
MGQESPAAGRRQRLAAANRADLVPAAVDHEHRAAHPLGQLPGLLAAQPIRQPPRSVPRKNSSAARRRARCAGPRPGRGFLEAAQTKGQPFALARAERALGLVAPDRDFAAHFEMALAHFGRTRDTFETGRTKLSYGERLRRARRRGEARRQLAEALEVFDRLGATPGRSGR